MSVRIDEPGGGDLPAGVHLAIDDFGCGHSSLSALSKLPSTLPYRTLGLDVSLTGYGAGVAVIDFTSAPCVRPRTKYLPARM